MSAETWFAVREGDIFPEEFRNFVMLPGELGAGIPGPACRPVPA